MAFSVPDLPYDFAALEPHIDARTMEIHHDKHHAAYVAKLNAAVAGTPLADVDINDLVADAGAVSNPAIRNNGGGHANHSLFWTVMSGAGGGEPSGDLAAAIDAAFGSFAGFQEKFSAAAANRFGSGWAWLSVDGGGLIVESTPNQDTPLMDGRTPILGIDVWEHAYYLNYQNRRPDYIAAFYNVIDWNSVAARFAAAR
ncbi:MAG: superoxide dismutase [Bryobacterales bacterium]|nr:superoxide dismutase [Bryobacterales bacterium]MDE0622208.1 superoxide dismutase [Bryobacterales bacterium]